MVICLLRKLFALSLLCVCAWLLYAYGIGQVISERLLKSQTVPTNFKMPLYLSSEALVLVAQKNPSGQFDAEALSIRALSQDPTSGKAGAVLMSIFVSKSRFAEAGTAANLSGRLWPVDVYTSSLLADYWLSQNRIEKLFHELNILMIREPTLRTNLFPLIEEFTVNSGNFDPLLPFINTPPTWWNSFFYTLSQYQSLEVLTKVYRLREQSPVAINASERTSFVTRLIKEKQWQRALSHWEAGLDESQKKMFINGLYDGGFEEGEFNNKFGWFRGFHKSIEITPQYTYGAGGQKALKIHFKQGGKRIKFNHLSQRVFLKPGEYKLKFRARLDTLKNRKGLVWRVHCLSGSNTLLAESKPLKGKQAWKNYSLDFRVTSSCESQAIGLVAASRFAHNHVFSGQLWLDDVALESQE